MGAKGGVGGVRLSTRLGGNGEGSIGYHLFHAAPSREPCSRTPLALFRAGGPTGILVQTPGALALDGQRRREARYRERPGLAATLSVQAGGGVQLLA